jgi:hypothetical protein
MVAQQSLDERGLRTELSIAAQDRPSEVFRF